MNCLEDLSFNLSQDELNCRLSNFFEISLIDFTEPGNFVNLLKLWHTEYSIYDNWFNGGDTFEENFLMCLVFFLSRRKDCKKILRLKDKVKEWQNVHTNKIEVINDK